MNHYQTMRRAIFRFFVTGLTMMIITLGVLYTSCTSKTDECDELLDFLYAYMPLPDSVDYSRDFWIQNIESSLQARAEMPWGKSVPEREWRHFVLPVRVNNESLDTSRIVFYDELKERVKSMDMYNAVLEINHWCHEHVTYQPSDARTSSPLNTMRSAIGRCGEESTFTVAALRAMCIPARQVYTPRWAHTDDNHAWVEAWVDGQWHFLGACEPEPELNLGWFNSSAHRAMLVHTRVFGTYDGPEEVLSRNKCYTEINVTRNYAPTKTITVEVVNTDGKPASATVDFRLYNYAEFYPIATKQSDENGLATLQCGLGDLLIWASDGNHFGLTKTDVRKDDTVRLVLDLDRNSALSLDLDIYPPIEQKTEPDRSSCNTEQNKARLAREDSIRNVYIQNAFYHGEDELLTSARANYSTLHTFLDMVDNKEHATVLLHSLSQKDLRDITLDVLLDHYSNTTNWLIPEIYSPRVSNEPLTPYRATLREHLPPLSPMELIQWCRDSITIDESSNPQHLCMSPLGVYRHRTCDSHSRDIFFVASARSLGIPARIDGVTGKVQWSDGVNWFDVLFEETTTRNIPTGTLQLTFEPSHHQTNPSYYNHFTLNSIQKSSPHLLEFDEGTTTWSNTFANPHNIDMGQYLLTSGTRLANGGVLAHIELFTVSQSERVRRPLLMRQSTDQLEIIGSFNSEAKFCNTEGIENTLLATTGRGYYVCGVIRPNHEPSTHALNDIIAVANDLEQWGRKIILLFPSIEDMRMFDINEFKGLPSTVVFGVASSDMLNELQNQELTANATLPLFLMADTFNRVVWAKHGYTISLGEQLLQVISKL